MKRTMKNVHDELEAIKTWLLDLSDDLTANTQPGHKELHQAYSRLTSFQDKLKEQCRSKTN